MANPNGTNLFINTKAVCWEFTVVVPSLHFPKGEENDRAREKSGFFVFLHSLLKVVAACSWSICHKKPKQEQIIQKRSEKTIPRRLWLCLCRSSREWNQEKQFAPQQVKTSSDSVKSPWRLHLKFSPSQVLLLPLNPPETAAAGAPQSPEPKAQLCEGRGEQSSPLPGAARDASTPGVQKVLH